ncbi:MAG TPA: hypothetical protein PLF17_14725, partial [Chitinophagaceae bacterium]|nr:hypothetical protein [Chitinophagaceae bacterium]HQZ51784.1 hypothetical protein [Chitinophagaceae bacterium]
MKNIFILFSLFLGSSLLATNADYAIRSKVNKRFSWNNAGPVGKVSIVVDKSDYELNIYDDIGWYATYPVVFG